MEIPVGWYFQPTDEELILEYLMRKNATPDLFRVPYIKDVDIYNFHPTQLIANHGGCDNDDKKNEYYIFMQWKNEGGNSNRASRSGINESMWKATSGEQEVKDCTSNQIIGYKITLVYYEDKTKDFKTNWIMHEYRATTQQSKQPYEWVICRIYERTQGVKKKNNKVTKEVQENNKLQMPPIHKEYQNHGEETHEIIQDFNQAFSVYMDRGLDGFLSHQFLY